MSTPEQEQNPTMAEILSSIRHVIAKTETQNSRGESSSSSQDDVLELTNPLEEPSPKESVHSSYNDPLLSRNSEHTASTAFQHLSRAVEIKQSQDETKGLGGKTVDDLVKEIMRPFIKEWLNQHLPLVVERLVSKEIDRLAAQARSSSVSSTDQSLSSSASGSYKKP